MAELTLSASDIASALKKNLEKAQSEQEKAELYLVKKKRETEAAEKLTQVTQEIDELRPAVEKKVEIPVPAPASISAANTSPPARARGLCTSPTREAHPPRPICSAA